jgi:hypothetical protein
VADREEVEAALTQARAERDAVSNAKVKQCRVLASALVT